MSEENVEVSETPTLIDATVVEEERISESGNALEQLKVLQENLGQMLELSKEESDLIKEFSTYLRLF